MTEQQKNAKKLAKDVLKQLAAKMYIAAHTYVAPRAPYVIGELQDVFKSTKCKVCGLGSLFVFACRLFNDSPAKKFFEANDSDSLKMNAFRRRLKKYFPPMQLALIETAFEGFWSSGARTYEIKDADMELFDKARKFGRRYVSDTTRLKRIMQNILDNKGEFKP